MNQAEFNTIVEQTKLTEQGKEILHCVLVQGYGYSEAATKFGVTKQNVAVKVKNLEKLGLIKISKKEFETTSSIHPIYGSPIVRHAIVATGEPAKYKRKPKNKAGETW